ncbi:MULTISPECIES: YecR family lipoprotein [Pseudomonas]|uniref:Lipoprotein n=1 Tax=Pseudomonas paralactis TaxID=1615673 RepID=A0A0R3AC14_9PSED|nr:MULTISPECIES: YecR family lipoprotein [Pseudomonas]KRP69629.1 lipoprotein [Pseudomonas paralactis]QOY73626.1 hypothetical protein IH404_11440 [Pseudomonas sp. OST1909]
MKSVIVAIALPLFAGCATPKYWEATGSSATSYVRTPFEYAQIRESQGLAIATGRGQFWDYQRAERAGDEKSECRTTEQFHCLETTVTQDYQCQK